MSIFTNPDRIPENYGLKIAAGLIVYFLIMKFAGLGLHVELRLFNLIIQVVGIYYGLKKYKETHGSHINYFRALITGVVIGAIGSAIFAVFMFAYLSLDTAFMKDIVEYEQGGRFLNPYISSFIVALEGVFSGLLATFVLINYLSTDEVSES